MVASRRGWQIWIGIGFQMPIMASRLLLSRVEGSPTFRFLKVGRALIARLGMEATHVTAEFRPDPNDEMLGSLTGAHRRCVRTSSPSYEYARYDFGEGDPVLFERLILPVSDGGERVTHLVGLALLSGSI